MKADFKAIIIDVPRPSDNWTDFSVLDHDLNLFAKDEEVDERVLHFGRWGYGLSEKVGISALTPQDLRS